MAVAYAQRALLPAAVAQPDEPTSAFERRVLAALPRSRPIPIYATRAALREATGLSDRKVRQAIQLLRRLGWPVISDSRGRGYSLAAHPDDIEPTVAEMYSRARECIAAAEALSAARERMRAEAMW